MVNWIITLVDKFELPYESYSASAVQHYFQYIIKKHKTLTNNPPARIYVNKVDNRITFKIKARYYPECFTPEHWNYFEALKIS